MMGANMQIGRSEINLLLFSSIIQRCSVECLCWKLVVYVSRVHF